MKNKKVEIATLVLMVAVALLGLLNIIDPSLLPDDYKPYLPWAIAVVIMIKQLAYGVLDWMDDGKLNGSFKITTIITRVTDLEKTEWTQVSQDSSVEAPDKDKTNPMKTDTL